MKLLTNHVEKLSHPHMPNDYVKRRNEGEPTINPTILDSCKWIGCFRYNRFMAAIGERQRKWCSVLILDIFARVPQSLAAQGEKQSGVESVRKIRSLVH